MGIISILSMYIHLTHNSQVKTSTEEVKPKLFTEALPTYKIMYANLFKGFKYTTDKISLIYNI